MELHLTPWLYCSAIILDSVSFIVLCFLVQSEINIDWLNIHNGQVAWRMSMWQSPWHLVGRWQLQLRNSLSTGFHTKLSSPVNTMEHLKRGVNIGNTVMCDLESIFIHLLTVGQQREMDILPIFCQYLSISYMLSLHHLWMSMVTSEEDGEVGWCCSWYQYHSANLWDAICSQE